MQKIDYAALILVPEQGGDMWAEEVLFQPLIRVVSRVLMRSGITAVIFDGCDELRDEIERVFPPEQVLTSAQAAEHEVGITVAIPAPAFVDSVSLRSLVELVPTQGPTRITDESSTIAFAADGLLDEQRVKEFDNGYSCAMSSSSCIVVHGFEELASAEEHAASIINRRLERSGVRVVRPSTVSVGEDCLVERGAVILPNTIIRHGSVIHSGAVVGPNTLVDNSEIGPGTTVNQSQVYDSKIGANTSVGPFAHVRPECSIGNDCRVGAFVEVKKSNIGNGTKSAHLTFIGDADVGDNVNFGCGTVISNYDGLKKHRTTIGDGAFIGCNTNLIAPVKVGANAYTAAGATVTKEVPEYALYIGRPEPVIKEGWAKRVMELRDKARLEKAKH